MKPGFSKKSMQRIVQGIRTVERIYGSQNIVPPGYGLPPGGASPVHVLITEPRITNPSVPTVPGVLPADVVLSTEYLFYPAVFTFRNPISESIGDDYIDSDLPCLAVALNDTGDPAEILAVGKRYGGHIVGYRNGKALVVVIVGGTEDTFLAHIYAKCYYDGSGDREANGVTPDPGAELNCPANMSCLTRYPIYSWSRVVESDNCPLTFAEVSPRQEGSPQCFPLYHIDGEDLPVYPPSSPRTNYCGDAVSNSGAGSVAWSSAGSAQGTPDDQWASCSLTGGQSTHRLYCTGFCFGLPGGITITNVEVRVEAHASGSGVPDLDVKLLVNDAPVGNSKHTGVDLGTTDAIRSYSHSPTNWGYAGLSVLEVNDDGFGVTLRYDNTSGASRTVYVDAIEIKISFTTAGTTIPRHSVVRIWRGKGNYYLMNQQPWIDLFHRTNTVEGAGFTGYHKYFDQNDSEWKRGEDVRVVISE